MQVENQMLQHYAVYYARYDGALLYQDLLYELRRDFFSNGQRLKNKIVRNVDGTAYRYSYLLEQGSPMKWKKLAGYRLLEKSEPNGDGSYRIVTQDASKRVCKAAWYTSAHVWLKTEYFAPDIKRTPAAVLSPVPGGRELLMQEFPADGEQVAYELWPCEIPIDINELNALNSATSVPEIICRTNMGEFYYCKKEEAQRRNEALAAIRKGNQVKPLFVPEREEEPEESSADREEGFQVDTSAFPPEQTGPVAAVVEETQARIEDLDRIKQEVQDTIQRYDDSNSYQYGSVDVEKYMVEEPEKTEEPAEDLPVEQEAPAKEASARPEEQTAPPEQDVPAQVETQSVEEPLSEEQTPMEQGTDSSDARERQENAEGIVPSPAQQAAYTYEPVRPEEPADLETMRLSPDERQRVRRYNVMVKPIDGEAYCGAPISPVGQPADSSAEEPLLMPEDAENGATRELAGCNGAENGCPYLPQGKMRIDVAPGESYYYYGEIADGLREGRGRTAMQNGDTAYEGDYLHDKRDGFGVYYYKTGKLCYAGNWKENRRNGTGVSFRPGDGTIHVGRWEEDVPVGMGSRFDRDGNLLFAGRWENGKRQGAGITYYAQDGRIFVGQWENDVLAGKGTEFDAQGNLLYTGGWARGMRNGFGTEYNEQGDVVYIGQWLDNQYHGEGALHLPEGGAVKGAFLSGVPCGQAVEYDANGCKVYEGSWQDGRYHGQGCKYFPNGGRYQGSFAEGEPIGFLEGYNPEGQLVYKGQWKDDQYNGEGCYYVDGEKVYEGSFRANCFEGHGFAYQNGSYVYSGSFVQNQRCGFGTSYSQGRQEYVGQWQDGQYHGLGLLYERGEARWAGEFCHGKRHGRVNTIVNGQVYEEGVYENDELLYVKRYQDGSLVLEGNVQNGVLNGMGCTFTAYGEKLEEGIFRDGSLVKSMKVTQRALQFLPQEDTLAKTEYARYCAGPAYAVEQLLEGGIYSGQLHDGRPHGRGTLLRRDHRYTGSFQNGVPCGEGVLYQDDGTTQEGLFLTAPKADARHILFTDGVAYDFLPNQGQL